LARNILCHGVAHLGKIVKRYPDLDALLYREQKFRDSFSRIPAANGERKHRHSQRHQMAVVPVGLILIGRFFT
jgi:hypothetical protein